MSPPVKYWFPAKRYGWGWGIPSRWQGWAVLLGYIGLLPPGAIWFPPDRLMGNYLAYVFALSGVLVALCWWKGEPPRWRWGDSESPPSPAQHADDGSA